MSRVITWDKHADINGTSLQGYLTDDLFGLAGGSPWPWGFAETVARLAALSGQVPGTDAACPTDEYKVSVEFIGRFGSAVFTLYDWKEGRSIHIGARPACGAIFGDPAPGLSPADMAELRAALRQALAAVSPVPYSVREHYDACGRHGWPTPTGTATRTRAPRQPKLSAYDKGRADMLAELQAAGRVK